MSEPISLLRRGAVLEVVLDRPERRNAISAEMLTRLTAAFTELHGDRSVGAVLVRGAGGFFCSGLDIKEFDVAALPMDRWIEVHRALAALDLPVVAAVAGGAVNAGAALALACDLMVVAESAYLQIGEAALGLTPPVNAAWLVLRHSPAVALQLTLTGRRFSGPELRALGVASDVVADDDVLETARALTARMAGFPAGAAARTKRAVRAAAACAAGRFPGVLAAAIDADSAG